jgi:hypothetical protein
LGVNEAAACATLKNAVLDIGGDHVRLFDSSGPLGSFEVDLSYSIYAVSVHLEPANVGKKQGLIVFDRLGVDTTFFVKATINLNAIWDNFPLPLPPRCIKVCVPFTSWCYSKCIDLGSPSFSLPGIPISFDAAGVYRPGTLETADDLIVYPEVDSITPFVIDPNRILERVCAAIAGLLPWPLSLVSSRFCDIFGSLFGLFEDAVARAVNELVVEFFKETGGWVGPQLKGVHLLDLSRHYFPGTGNGAIPFIPVNLTNFEVFVNSAKELDVRLIVLSAA